MSVSPAPGLLSVEAARESILAATRPVATERIATADSLGRVVAETVTAALSLPPWANSAMDGYAIQATDTAGATDAAPLELRVIGDLAAGATPDVTVQPGTCVRIATGARLPPGADAVVPVEATTPIDGARNLGLRGRDATGPPPAACLVHEPVRWGGSVRDAGSDLVAGAILLEPGTALTAAAVTLVAGAGVAEVVVHQRPRIAVLATGDEIRSVGEPLGLAGIPDANGPGLRALVTVSGGEPIDLGLATDRLDDVVARLRRGLASGADALIVAGGVSVGPYDVVRTAFETIGRIDLWRVAVQPGKPFAFGTAERPDGGAPVLLFGLPGNPVSSAVTFELFVRPAIRRLAGRRDLLRPVDRAVIDEAVSKSHGRRAFLRVESERDADGSPIRDDRGRVRVRLAGAQGSHVISSLAAADALAVISEDDDTLPAGAEVALWWLDRA
ncbi:MAG: gephyrin-like molybdotransferase Glp [Chloroflexota bacterium]